MEKKESGPLELPEIVFGGAALSAFYNSEATIASDIPVRTVRLALQCVISTMSGTAHTEVL